MANYDASGRFCPNGCTLDRQGIAVDTKPGCPEHDADSNAEPGDPETLHRALESAGRVMGTRSGPETPPPFSFGSDVLPGLAKLNEEAGEVCQVVGKYIMTGGRDEHWDGTNLRERLEDEIADVQAAIVFLLRWNSFDQEKIAVRAAKKLALFEKWRSERVVK